MIMETAFTHEINLRRIALKLTEDTVYQTLFSSNTFKTLFFFCQRKLGNYALNYYDRKGTPPKLMTHQLKCHKLIIQKLINDTW